MASSRRKRPGLVVDRDAQALNELLSLNRGGMVPTTPAQIRFVNLRALVKGDDGLDDQCWRHYGQSFQDIVDRAGSEWCARWDAELAEFNRRLGEWVKRYCEGEKAR